MRIFNKVLLLGLVALCQSSERDSDGKIYENLSQGIRLWSTPQQVLSLGYPGPAPHDLVQTWRYVAMGQETNKALKIVCPQIDVPHGLGGCGDTLMVIKDGDSVKEVCESSLNYITKSDDVSIIFRTGGQDGGNIRCTVQAILVDARGNEVVITTPKPTTRPAKNQFRFVESEEVDSSEHGSEPGLKTTTCLCGVSNKMFSRIVNGSVAGRNEFPFAAALVDRRTGWNFCGGTVITEYHVITAAHCTSDSLAKNQPISVKLGVHNVRQDVRAPAQFIDVEKIHQHERYTGPPAFKHDISLLVLSKRIVFGPYVSPACLPEQYVTLDRQYVKIIGWGDTSYRGSSSDVLRKANVRVVPLDECNFEYSDVDVDLPTQICTYSKNRDSCQGDSGGPVIWMDPDTNRFTLVGAVSFGFGCRGKPSVHTAIGHYVTWIKQHVQASKRSQVCQKSN